MHQIKQLAQLEGAVVVLVPLLEQVLEFLRHEAALCVVDACVGAVLFGSRIQLPLFPSIFRISTGISDSPSTGDSQQAQSENKPE